MELTTEIAKSLITQGPLVALLFWLYVQNNVKLEKKDEQIARLISEKDKSVAELNKEMREFQEKSLNKANEVFVNITAAVNGLKETLRNA